MDSNRSFLVYLVVEPEVAAVAEPVVAESSVLAWVASGRPYDTSGTSADAGTTSGGSWCGICVCTEASCTTSSYPRDKLYKRCHLEI